MAGCGFKLRCTGTATCSGKLTLTVLKSSPAPSQTHSESVRLVLRKAHGNAFDATAERFLVELGVKVVGLDSAGPLKDVQVAEVGHQSKVVPLRKILHACRGHRTLGLTEVAGFGVNRLRIRQGRGQPGEVLL